MRRRTVCLLVVALGASVGFGTHAAFGATSAGRRGGLRVVAAFYPLAWVAGRVGGADARVSNLTPPGVEPHDLELRPSQRDAIEDADLVIVLGGGFQPAVEDAADARDARTVRVLERLGLDGMVAAHDHDEEGHDHDAAHDESSLDPHVWLDPVMMRRVVRVTSTALGRIDRSGRRGFERRGALLEDELESLDADYRSGLSDCERRLVVTAHEAFGWLADRYGLEQRGVAGLTPDAEPTPERLASLADLARRENVTTVFTETLVSPKVAQTLAREAGGLVTDVLDPLEGLSERDLRRGGDYVSVMRDNLRKLRLALDCS